MYPPSQTLASENHPEKIYKQLIKSSKELGTVTNLSKWAYRHWPSIGVGASGSSRSIGTWPLPPYRIQSFFYRTHKYHNYKRIKLLRHGKIIHYHRTDSLTTMTLIPWKMISLGFALLAINTVIIAEPEKKTSFLIKWDNMRTLDTSLRSFDHSKKKIIRNAIATHHMTHIYQCERRGNTRCGGDDNGKNDYFVIIERYYHCIACSEPRVVGDIYRWKLLYIAR